MAINQNDVRLYASERMTDFADGGGRMSPTVIVDGLDNNVFPDITDLERLTGRTSLRKIFGAVVSANTDTYLSAHALLDDAPDDAATEAALFTLGTLTSERAAAMTDLAANASRYDTFLFSSPLLTPPFSETVVAVYPGGVVGPTLSEIIVSERDGLSYPAVGSYVGVAYAEGGGEVAGGRVSFRRVTATAVASGSSQKLTLDSELPSEYTVLVTNVVCYPLALKGSGFTSACASVAAGIAAAATAVTLTRDAFFPQVVPRGDDAPNPASAEAILGTPPALFRYSEGRVVGYRAGQPVLIHSTIKRAPAAQANTDVVNVGRTTLSRLRVIGNNGVEHARFTRGVPPAGGVGCTADLDAGTVTFTDVSGMSQPLTIEHRIEEMVLISSIDGLVLTLNRAVSRAYPAGSTKVSSLLMLGDLQGRVQAGFAQTAWTGVWSDTRIGGEPIADFDDVTNPITTTNQGAVPQRWTVQFTNSTSFRVFGEFLGEIGTGNTGANFAPINPSTGAPYFTIPAAGWGASWSTGNVYRFNTDGSQAPLWALRCVAPSLPGGDDSVTVEFRGYVNT